MLGFGAYEPDKEFIQPGVSRAITNALPSVDPEVGIDYRPMPDFVTTPGASALPGIPQGAISIVNPSNGNYEVYATTSTNIYRLQADYTWTSIGGGYNLPAEDTWAIVQFGNYLIFSNTIDGQLQYNVVTPGAVTSISGAPKARFLFVAFDCVFALDCDGENRLMRNSGINNHTQWTPGDNGAGSQPIPDGQELVAGGALTDGVAVTLQRNSARVENRTGTRQIFSMEKAGENIGAVGARSVVNSGQALYFLATDGFWAISSTGFKPIGAGRVNRTFYSLVNEALLYLTTAAYDPVNKCVIWIFPEGSNPAGTMYSGLGYSEESDSWFKFVPGQALSAIYQFATPGYGMDSIDGFGTLDGLPYSLDSRFWLGGQPRLAGIGSDLKAGFFDGDDADAYLETNADFSEVSRLINFATVASDSSDLDIGIIYGDSLAVQTTTAAVTTTNQRAALRARGKHLRFYVRPRSWSFIKGVDFVEGASGGRR